MNVEYMKTPLGTIRIQEQEGKLTGIHLLTDGEPEGVEQPSEITREAAKQLLEYFRGKRTEFDLPLDFSKGSPFMREVWKQMAQIPYGKTISYGKLAEKAGNKKACRACGTAVGRNPFIIVVPCHRVIKGDGSIGGFAPGVDKKRILMNVEGIELCRK
ncbi:MAG: methylated-DNA--[protein]-cysteine S-methyltransferase [Firmicutes bacterium]|nr:methylated-DNA--[protein]-cysteine S-methyltransferase [Bacillota bacterium]